MNERLDYLQAKITDKASLLELCHELCSDLERNPDNWENHTLEQFLEAMTGWIQDMDGYYKNIGAEIPKELSWKILGDILTAAKDYE